MYTFSAPPSLARPISGRGGGGGGGSARRCRGRRRVRGRAARAGRRRGLRTHADGRPEAWQAAARAPTTQTLTRAGLHVPRVGSAATVGPRSFARSRALPPSAAASSSSSPSSRPPPPPGARPLICFTSV